MYLSHLEQHNSCPTSVVSASIGVPTFFQILKMYLERAREAGKKGVKGVEHEMDQSCLHK